MPVLDVFKGDGFSMASLTDGINKLPFKPSRIGELGLFETQGVTNNTVLVEERNGVLGLVPTKRRGEPATTVRSGKRKVRAFAIPHIPLEDQILAEQVQGIRQFGSESEEEGVAQVVNDRMAAMRQDHEVTLEYHRVGAVQGHVMDADGVTELFDLFAEFEVTEQTLAFALDTATTDARLKVIAAVRLVERALGALPYSKIHAICGATWFDAFIGNEYVKDAYHRFQDSANLRNDPRKGFEFAGVTFEEYRGAIGSVNFVAAGVARFFPLGVPGLFKTYYGPGNFMEAVNTVGLPLYAKQEEMKFGRGVDLLTEQNPLCVCTRPLALVEGTI